MREQDTRLTGSAEQIYHQEQRQRYAAAASSARRTHRDRSKKLSGAKETDHCRRSEPRGEDTAIWKQHSTAPTSKTADAGGQRYRVDSAKPLQILYESLQPFSLMMEKFLVLSVESLVSH
ncbi:unnamed protein product [Leuciscus chuanchicus]